MIIWVDEEDNLRQTATPRYGQIPRQCTLETYLSKYDADFCTLNFRVCNI